MDAYLGPRLGQVLVRSKGPAWGYHLGNWLDTWLGLEKVDLRA